MSRYNLSAIIKLRTYYNNQAQKDLAISLNELNEQNKKLQRLNNELIKIKNNRLKTEDHFLESSYIKPKNTFELRNQQNLLNKNLQRESYIYQSIIEQKNQYLKAKEKYFSAQKKLMKTEQELKIIKKHYKIFLDKKNKDWQLNTQNQIDELNTNKYVFDRLKKL